MSTRTRTSRNGRMTRTRSVEPKVTVYAGTDVISGEILQIHVANGRYSHTVRTGEFLSASERMERNAHCEARDKSLYV